jgi:ethanolamine utilization protein EutN/carbon dioxide concentrating mechanism protein CcmL
LQIGEVVGTVVSTRKDPKLLNLKFQVVRKLDEQNRATGGYIIAVDTVGAGHGDLILYATGSSARQTVLTDARPADAAIMAIIDSWDVEGKLIYQK